MGTPTQSELSQRGCIWLLWKPEEFSLKLLDEGPQWLHVLVQQNGWQLQLTLVYDYNALVDRLPLWQILQGLGASMSQPWLIRGDFNNPLQISEKLRGNPLMPYELQAFQSCVTECIV